VAVLLQHRGRQRLGSDGVARPWSRPRTEHRSNERAAPACRPLSFPTPIAGALAVAPRSPAPAPRATPRLVRTSPPRRPPGPGARPPLVHASRKRAAPQISLLERTRTSGDAALLLVDEAED
jgi:hypothetical protein